MTPRFEVMWSTYAKWCSGLMHAHIEENRIHRKGEVDYRKEHSKYRQVPVSFSHQCLLHWHNFRIFSDVWTNLLVSLASILANFNLLFSPPWQPHPTGPVLLVLCLPGALCTVRHCTRLPLCCMFVYEIWVDKVVEQLAGDAGRQHCAGRVEEGDG